MLKRPESVLVVVYTIGGQILMLQRADDLDFWQSVTGSLLPTESPRQAAERELFEETGLVCTGLLDCQKSSSYAIREQWLHRYATGTTHNTEHVFLAPFPDVQAVTLSPLEHVDFTWVGTEQALQHLWSATNRQAVNDFVIPRIS